MGRFSTTLNVKCADLAKVFTELMKKRGFETCKEDEASLSYLVAQGGEWATCACSDYNGNPRQAGEDAEFFANELKTPVIFIEVVDSDFAILRMNGDEVIAGDGSGYGIEDAPKGSKAVWEPFLVSGTFEELTEIWSANEVFVEDALCKSAPLLGIDPNYIYADFRDLSELSDDKNVTALYFKKSAAKAKAMSLNAAFVKVFGEVLEPLGFKKIEYKYPCFVRIVGDEIIQIITYMKMKGHPFVDGYERTDCSQYDIVCKVETVYSTEIELPTKNFEKYSSYLGKREIYGREHMFDLDKNYWKKAVKYFPHKSGDEKLTISGLEEAIDLTKQILLPALDGVTDLKSFLEYIYKFYGTPFLDYNPGHYDHLNQYDGLVRIKVDTCESFLKRDEEYRLRGFDRSDKVNKVNCAKDPEKLAHYLGKVDKERNEYISKHEERELFTKQMFGDKEWCEKAFEELERRKAANTELLRSYGLDI